MKNHTTTRGASPVPVNMGGESNPVDVRSQLTEAARKSRADALQKAKK